MGLWPEDRLKVPVRTNWISRAFLPFPQVNVFLSLQCTGNHHLQIKLGVYGVLRSSAYIVNVCRSQVIKLRSWCFSAAAPRILIARLTYLPQAGDQQERPNAIDIQGSPNYPITKLVSFPLLCCSSQIS